MIKEKNKPSFWVVSVCIFLSLIFIVSGVYALIEKKIIIAGKYSGELYQLGSTESLLIAISEFMVAAFFVLILFERKLIKRVAEWLLGIGVVIFIFSAFA